jgi:hypothetical protein
MTTQNKTTAATSSPATPVQTQYPVVEFEYPDSDSGKMKLRYLKVVSADADYVKGYELDTPGSKKDGQFKSFLRNRLARNGVSLVSF